MSTCGLLFQCAKDSILKACWSSAKRTSSSLYDWMKLVLLYLLLSRLWTPCLPETMVPWVVRVWIILSHRRCNCIKPCVRVIDNFFLLAIGDCSCHCVNGAQTFRNFKLAVCLFGLSYLVSEHSYYDRVFPFHSPCLLIVLKSIFHQIGTFIY